MKKEKHQALNKHASRTVSAPYPTLAEERRSVALKDLEALLTPELIRDVFEKNFVLQNRWNASICDRLLVADVIPALSLPFKNVADQAEGREEFLVYQMSYAAFQLGMLAAARLLGSETGRIADRHQESGTGESTSTGRARSTPEQKDSDAA